jgi:hypothetical protein
MNRARLGVALALAGLLVSAAAAGADVKTREKSLVKFEGMMGKVMGFFGGKAAKEGVVSTVAVKGDRKATFGDNTGEIVDLAEEKVYQINLKDKSYKVLTFAEIRKKLQEEARKAEEEARKMEQEKKDDRQVEMTVDFDVKDTGQKKTINGYDCRQVVITVYVYEKGKSLEKAGGFVMTVDSWMAPGIAEMKELHDFDVRYARKLTDEATLASAEGMVQMMAMYPGFKKAMDKLAAEQGSLGGTPIQSITTMHTVMTAEQAQARKEEGAKPSGSGGVVGGMLGRFGRKKAEEPKEPAAAAAGNPNRTLVMTSTTEVLSVATAVVPADVSLPAGFRQK